MAPSTSPLLRFVLIVILLALALPREVAVWIDAKGHPLLTDRPEAAGAAGVRIEPEQLRLRWRGHLLEPQPPLEVGGSGADASDARELRDAYTDVQQGELRRALQSLRRLARDSTLQADAAWLLARVELHRGRLEPARDALVGLLALSGPRALEMKSQAQRLLADVESELAHAQRSPGSDRSERAEMSDHYTLIYDHAFAGRDFGERLLASLEQVREELRESLGRTLGHSLEVRLYTRAQYLENYKHRFGFATVGFYDGAIHAVSTRQPRLRLKALLTHEHTHALFLDVMGSHQPFFLNEGIAEREEERVLGRTHMADEEWRELLDAQRAGEWIPLRVLTEGFAGLDGRRARLAYLESRAAVELIAARPGALPRWLARCAGGEPWEKALQAEIGLDTAGLDAALSRDVHARFPELPEGLRVGPAQSSGAQ